MNDDHHDQKRDMRHIKGLAYPLVNGIAAIRLCLFISIAVASTWPLASHLRTALPLGTEQSATVPLFTSWTIWWNCDRLRHRYNDYWDAPIFAGCPDTFAFSEPMPLTVLGAPVYWLTDSPAATGNAILLLALTMNGWSAFRFFSRVLRSQLVALLGAVMIELLPFVHHELAVLQLVPLCGVIWTLHALHRWSQRPNWFDAILTGVSCGVTYLLCSYYGLFLLILLVVSAPWLLWRDLKRARTWCLAGVSAIVFLLLVAPVVCAQLRVTEAYRLHRAPANVGQFSATLSDYRFTPWQTVWNGAADSPSPPSRLFSLHPGNFKVCLAVLGAVVGMRYRKYRRWTAFSLVLLVASMVFSLGPGLQVAGWSPYGLLVQWIPGFAQVRSPFRFALFVQLAIVQLAVIGLDVLLVVCRFLATKVTHNRMPWLAVSVVAALGVAAAVELWPPPQRLFLIPPAHRDAPWIAWLRDRTPEDSVVACLPFPTGRTERDFQATALWMYAATYHKRALVNGYSGFFPQADRQLQDVLASFPSDASLSSLEARGVDYCIVSSTAKGLSKVEAAAGFDLHLQLVFVDTQAQVDIYRLVTKPRSNGER